MVLNIWGLYKDSHYLYSKWKYIILCFEVRSSVRFASVAQSCSTLCKPMDCSTPGFSVHNQLREFTQSHVHWVGDAIQPSHPLSSPSPPAPNPSQHQSLFQWVSSSHQVAKELEFQLHQSFQWISHVHWVNDGVQPAHPRASYITVQFFSSRNTEFGLWSWSLLGLGQVFMVWNTLPRAGIVSMLSSSWFAGRQCMTVVGWWPYARYSDRERVTLWELICFRESYLFVQEGLHRSSSWSHWICQQEQVRCCPVCEPICGNV